MFTQKMTMCLVGLALLTIATTSCSKKQSTYSVDIFPYTATVKGVVAYWDTTAAAGPLPSNLVKHIALKDAKVQLKLTVSTVNTAKVMTTITNDKGEYEFTIPVASPSTSESIVISVASMTSSFSPAPTYGVKRLTVPNSPTTTIAPNSINVVDTLLMKPQSILIIQ